MIHSIHHGNRETQQSCDVLIPVYNSPEWLELCVEAAIDSDCSDVIHQILLIDDCSNEATKKLIQHLESKYEKVASIQNEENLGFVKTCNRGMALCQADYMMLLNSDCLLAKDTTARMIQTMRNHPEAGLICPLSNNAANLSVSIPEGVNYVQVDGLLAELPEKAYQACTIVGNCMMISKACYDAVGGLDEAFGMGYGEETDYQFRSAKMGFSAIVAGNAYVFHKSQVSFGNSEKLSAQKEKNRELFFSRWGKEYERLLMRYEKDDPAKHAECYVKNNLNRLPEISISPFDNAFIQRVDLIDQHSPKGERVQQVSEPTHVFRRYLEAYRRLGFVGFCKKAVRKLVRHSSN